MGGCYRMIAVEDMTMEDAASLDANNTGATPMDVCTSQDEPMDVHTSGSKSMEASIFKLVDSKEVTRPLESAASCSGGSHLFTSASCTRKGGATSPQRRRPSPERLSRASLERMSASAMASPFSGAMPAAEPVQQQQQLVFRGRMAEARSCTVDGPWKDVPDDILKRVLDCMPASYIRVVRRVCKGWSEAAARYIIRLKPEQLDGARLANRFPFLQALHLSHCHSAMVSQSQSALTLRSMLSDEQLGQQLPALEEMRSLRLLSLQRCGGITGNPAGPFRHIARLTQLTTVDISNCDAMREDAMEVIVKLPNLEALFMTGCGAMTDAALALLVAAKPNLRELEFGGSAAVTDAGLACLSQLRGLERLSMTRCPSISDEGLMHFLGLPKLRTVIISCCANITEEGVRSVAAHQTLKVVTAAVLPARRICSWQPSAYPTLDMRMVEY